MSAVPTFCLVRRIQAARTGQEAAGEREKFVWGRGLDDSAVSSRRVDRRSAPASRPSHGAWEALSQVSISRLGYERSNHVAPRRATQCICRRRGHMNAVSGTEPDRRSVLRGEGYHSFGAANAWPERFVSSAKRSNGASGEPELSRRSERLAGITFTEAYHPDFVRCGPGEAKNRHHENAPGNDPRRAPASLRSTNRSCPSPPT